MTDSEKTVTSSPPAAPGTEAIVVDKLFDLLSQDPTTFEITILPVSPEQKTLSLDESLILVENHLGLDARSLPWITQAIRKEYRRHRRISLAEQEEQEELQDSLFKITSCLLLVNPDHATVWADRRKCLLSSVSAVKEEKKEADVWIQELRYIDLLMTQHSKAPSSWGHRKYVLQKVLSSLLQSTSSTTSTSSANTTEDIVRQEIRLCTRVAESYPKNYYAWTHRRFLWTLLWSSIPKTNDTQQDQQPQQHLMVSSSLLEEEFLKMISWLETHVSDHSAAHYGGQVLQLWLSLATLPAATSDSTESATTTTTTTSESIAQLALAKSRALVQGSYRYSHETAWTFRRLVITILLKYCCHDDQQQKTKSSGTTTTTTINSTDGDDDSRNNIQALVYKEIEGVLQGVKTATAPADGSAAAAYPYTFLAWCLVQLRQYDAGSSSTIKLALKEETSFGAFPNNPTLLSVLQDHPNIAHLMWKQDGSAILQLDDAARMAA